MFTLSLNNKIKKKGFIRVNSSSKIHSLNIPLCTFRYNFTDSSNKIHNSYWKSNKFPHAYVSSHNKNTWLIGCNISIYVIHIHTHTHMYFVSYRTPYIPYYFYYFLINNCLCVNKNEFTYVVCVCVVVLNIWTLNKLYFDQIDLELTSLREKLNYCGFRGVLL